MKQGGLPQLDPTWFPSQLFWLAVTFVAMYVIVARILLPKIQTTLDNREQKLTGDLDSAAAMKTQAAKAQETYEASLKSARADAQKMVADVSSSIKQKAEEKSRELDISLAAKLAEADKAIAQAKEKAMDNLKPAAAEITALIIETLLKQKLDTQNIEAAIAQQLKERV